MDTPSQRLARQIAARLVKDGFLSAEAAKAMQPKLATGELKGEDWQLPIELASEKKAKS